MVVGAACSSRSGNCARLSRSVIERSVPGRRSMNPCDASVMIISPARTLEAVVDVALGIDGSASRTIRINGAINAAGSPVVRATRNPANERAFLLLGCAEGVRRWWTAARTAPWNYAGRAARTHVPCRRALRPSVQKWHLRSVSQRSDVEHGQPGAFGLRRRPSAPGGSLHRHGCEHRQCAPQSNTNNGSSTRV